MERKSLFLAVTSIFFMMFSISAQQGAKIDFEIENYSNDSLILGYYFGKQTLVLDTLLDSNQKAFTYQSEVPLNAGLYLALLKPSNQVVQFIIGEENQNLKLQLDGSDLSTFNGTGNTEIELFSEYLNFLNIKRKESDLLKSQIDTTQTKNNGTINAALDQISNEVLVYQESILKKHPDSKTAVMIRSNQNIDIPRFEGDQKSVEIQKYLYYKEHYFDHLNLADSFSFHMPIFNNKVDYYLEKLTSNHPDSINNSIDFLLEKMKPNELIYHYYLSNFLNKYGRSKVIGHDAIYVHLAENYYNVSDTVWIGEENRLKIIKEAEKIKPTLIGSTAPDFKLYTEDSIAVTLNSLTSPYTVLIFWAPDCTHCTKAMPDLVKFYNDYKDRGVEVITICNKTGSKYQDCWKSVEEKGMQPFINTGDKFMRSRILSKYNVRSTPSIFIIDENHEIVMKGIGVSQLGKIIDSLEKQKSDQFLTK